MSDVISATDLVKRFRNVPVLDGLNLTVPEGSVFGLAGPNGAGKTTTIKILMNILRPTSGHAEVLGVDSRRLGPEALANIGYVSEKSGAARMDDSQISASPISSPSIRAGTTLARGNWCANSTFRWIASFATFRAACE